MEVVFFFLVNDVYVYNKDMMIVKDNIDILIFDELMFFFVVVVVW